MRTGKTLSPELHELYRKESQPSIDYALKVIRESPLAEYVEAVYLYGSCARNEQTRYSDVDLFLQLKADTDTEKMRDDIRKLRVSVIPTDLDLPEVDLKVYVGDGWKTLTGSYYKNVREEGIRIW